MEINEPIDLYAVFKKGKIIPLAFKWHGQKHVVDDITIAYTQRDGVYMIYHFSLLAKDTYYSISIHGKDNAARLNHIEYQ
jgi:hypothetical protein